MVSSELGLIYLTGLRENKMPQWVAECVKHFGNAEKTLTVSPTTNQNCARSFSDLQLQLTQVFWVVGPVDF